MPVSIYATTPLTDLEVDGRVTVFEWTDLAGAL